MDEKKSIKVSVGTVVCIFIIILLVVALGIVYYMGFVQNNEKISNLENEKNKLEQQLNIINNNNTKQVNIDSKQVPKSESKTIDLNQLYYNCTDIKVFWTNFRNAVLSANYNEIKQFVKFPLKTRGPMDSDPIIEVNEENFEKTFKSFLQQYDGMRENETEYDWIKNHEMPKMLGGSDYDNAGNYIDLVYLENDNMARFADMIIEKDSDGYWHLTLIYYSEN